MITFAAVESSTGEKKKGRKDFIGAGNVRPRVRVEPSRSATEKKSPEKSHKVSKIQKMNTNDINRISPLLWVEDGVNVNTTGARHRNLPGIPVVLCSY